MVFNSASSTSLRATDLSVRLVFTAAFSCTMAVAGISTILGAATFGVGIFAGALIAGAACVWIIKEKQ